MVELKKKKISDSLLIKIQNKKKPSFFEDEKNWIPIEGEDFGQVFGESRAEDKKPSFSDRKCRENVNHINQK